MQFTHKVGPYPQYFHCAYHPQLSGLVKHATDTIQTQLGKFSEALNLPWPKAFLTALSNLKSVVNIAFLLMTVTGHPMNGDEGTYESTLLKGAVLHYYQGLINQLLGTNELVTFPALLIY